MLTLEKFNQLKILNKIDQLKQNITALKPLSIEVKKKIMQKFRLDWNYHSCAIEGNSLTYGETITYLMEGLTANGKPLKDHFDITGHNEAIDFLLDLAKNKRSLTETDVRDLHKILLKEPYYTEAKTPEGRPTRKLINLGTYKTMPNHVKTPTGEIHYYAEPLDTPAKMQELIAWYHEYQQLPLHPVIIAALFHHKFVAIHPFDDGNGRMARILMNLTLMQHDYPPVVIKQQERNAYYAALSKADAQDYEPFIEFVAQNLAASLELYLKGAKGESMDEPDDLDKELALLKKQLAGKQNKLEIKYSMDIEAQIMRESINPFLEKLQIVIGKFKELFFEYQIDKGRSCLGLSKNAEAPFYCTYLSLVNFKNEETPFSLRVVFFILFEKYRYNIKYSINSTETRENSKKEIERELITNYYHQQLAPNEIDEYCQIIGKDVMAYIKDKSKTTK